MKTQYIYLNYEFAENVNLFADIEKFENAKCITFKKKECKNILTKAIRKIHLSEKINKIAHFPFRTMWYGDLRKLKIEPDQNYVIILQAVIFWEVPFSLIKRLAKYKNVKLALILMDTVKVNSPAGEIIEKYRNNKIWDYIFTFDLEDSKKYGYYYLNEHYYPWYVIEEAEKADKIETDAYFLGALKHGRTTEIVDLYKKFRENNVNVRFDVVENQGRTLDYSDQGFNMLQKKKSYQDVLKEVQKTNCIIEFVQKGQKSQTLRYFESVCFNKKLLTNNPNVKNLKFYNEKYMKIFNTFDDIDFEWVKKREDIDYKYNGEFSSLHFIEELDKLQNKRND